MVKLKEGNNNSQNSEQDNINKPGNTECSKYDKICSFYLKRCCKFYKNKEECNSFEMNLWEQVKKTAFFTF